MIAKYRQREKISTTINFFNEEKRKWKEEEIQKMSRKVVSSMAASHSNNIKKHSVHIQPYIILKNTPH
jgi:hypothetical protein